MDLTAVLAVVVLTFWTAYSNQGPTWLMKLSEGQRSSHLDETVGQAKTEAMREVSNFEATSSPAKEARPRRTSLRQPFGESEIEYVKDDVTVRYFAQPPLRQPLRLGEAHVSYVGEDVTVTYFTPKPPGVSAIRATGSSLESTGSSWSAHANSVLRKLQNSSAWLRAQFRLVSLKRPPYVGPRFRAS